LDFLSSLTYCTQLSLLGFHQNRFGELPDLIGNFSTHLSWLQMGYNQIYGVIPQRIGQLINLTFLDIQHNFLDGTIPDSITKLKNCSWTQINYLVTFLLVLEILVYMLSKLYLSENQLEGWIPFSLRYCTHCNN